MVRIALISDTHIPSRATALPTWIADRIEVADHTIHAGDFDSTEAYETITDLTNALTGICGNTDPAGLDLPPVATLDIEGVRFVVTHGTGPPAGYDRRVLDTVTDHADDGPVVGVSGHTHELRDETRDGVRLLNPGSATGAWPATTATMQTVDVDDGVVRVTCHENE